MGPQQRNPRYLLLRLVLIWAGGFPFLYGAVGLISGANVVKITDLLSQGTVVLTPELQYLLKPLALYIMMFGALLIYAAIDPEKYRAIIIWGALVFLLRGLQRFLVTEELNRLFEIPQTLNLIHVGYLFLLAVSLRLLCPKPKRSANLAQSMLQ